jgi:hypothetical protein
LQVADFSRSSMAEVLMPLIVGARGTQEGAWLEFVRSTNPATLMHVTA